MAIVSMAIVSIGFGLRERGVVDPLQPTKATPAAAAAATEAATAAAATDRAHLLRARVGRQRCSVIDVDHRRVVHGRSQRVVRKGDAVRVALGGGHEGAEGLTHGALPLQHVAQAEGGVVASPRARLAAARLVGADLAVMAQVPPEPVAAQQRAPGESVEGDVGRGVAQLQRRLDEGRGEDSC